MKDLVKCCNCSTVMLVELGADICPKCGYDGALAWIDGLPQEVEDDYQIEKEGQI